MKPEEILAESLFLGGDGGINGGANFYPKLYVDLYNAAQKNEWDTVKKLHSKVINISTTIYSIGKFGSSYLKGIKTTLYHMGICNDFIAEPFHCFSDPEKKKLRTELIKLNIIK